MRRLTVISMTTTCRVRPRAVVPCSAQQHVLLRSHRARLLTLRKGNDKKVSVPYYHGAIEECSWAYFTGELRAGDWAAFVQDSRGVYATARPGSLLLTIPFSYGTPSAEQRRALGDVIRDSPGARNISHHAFVTDSSVLMAINSAITWLGNKPWLEKTFTEPDRALAWLTRAAQSLSPELILASIERVVPPSELWPKLKRVQR